MVGLVIGYSGWSMIKAIYQSYTMNQTIGDLHRRINNLKIANENLKNLNVYYQTKTFKELEARRRLNLKKPAEKVLIIPDHQKGPANLDFEKPRLEVDRQPAKEPNYLKWWRFVWQGSGG